MENPVMAPELVVSRWFNTPTPLTLAGLRGRVVLLHAFQMLCPGCVSAGIPQAERAHRMFRDADLTVIGLHTVFEHHAAMTPVSLEAFIHEYRLTFPIGVDQPGTNTPLPVTMQRYGLQGTPSTVLIGRDGQIRHIGFGREDDMAIGMMIGSLLAEAPISLPEPTSMPAGPCTDRGCSADVQS
ncbi:MAG: redoxin domain-containing protein [Beijerinckiaceae bacterium]|jgi:peroxiredoxin|nr:redoxin domain-containing protein [Beijerinckiaceae bacterium]